MAKHERTLAAVFAEPTRANIDWADIEALFVHLGARPRGPGVAGPGQSQRLRESLSPAPPRPGSPQVREVRAFLTNTGHEP